MKSGLQENSLHAGLLWFRIILGTGIAYHGALKIFGGKMAAFVRLRTDPFSVKELALAYGAAAVTLLISGPGRFSVDSRGA